MQYHIPCGLTGSPGEGESKRQIIDIYSHKYFIDEILIIIYYNFNDNIIIVEYHFCNTGLILRRIKIFKIVIYIYKYFSKEVFIYYFFFSFIEI